MKKQILILLILPLLFSCGDGKKIDNDLTLININSKVKEIIWTKFNVKESFGEIQKDSLNWKYELYFNVQGNQNLWYEYNSDEVLTRSGRKEFNEFNKHSEDNTYNGDGDLSTKTKYIYDQDKNHIELNTYNEDGSLSYKYTYRNDSKGNRTEASKYDENEELTEHCKYKYDIDGNLTEKSFYDKNIVLTRIEKYDKNKNIIELNYYNDSGKISGTWKSIHDDQGNIVETINYDENGDFNVRWTYKYEYDRKKNWILMNTYSADTVESLVYSLDKEIMTISEREIIYY